MSVGRGPSDSGSTDGKTLVEENNERADQEGPETAHETAANGRFADGEIFDILRNSRRREVLSYLLEDGGQASVTELTQHVAAQEYDIETEEVVSEQYKRVYNALYQCHLPRLHEFGVVVFDKDEKTVSLDSVTPRIEAYLQGSDRQFVKHVELSVALLVASVVTLGVAGVGPLGSVSVVAWAGFTAVALTALALLLFSTS